MNQDHQTDQADHADRQAWMGVLAKAPAAALARVVDDLGPEPAFSWLRAPEFGSVMARGRMGGAGAPFNLGEITVTRCALTLTDGTEVNLSHSDAGNGQTPRL